MLDCSLSKTASVDIAALLIHTEPIAAQVGYYATPAPGQSRAINGADLGWAFTHRDKIWVLFGDSWWLDPVNARDLPDDALGQISLTDFPDGLSVEAFVRAHPAPSGQPAWRAAGPSMPVIVPDAAGSEGFAPIISTYAGEPLPSGIGNVPMTGFSNGRADAGEAVFAIFFNFEPVQCVQGSCDFGLECDASLGRDTSKQFHPVCVVGSGSSCRPGPGLCQDRDTSVYDPTSNSARMAAVRLRHYVGATTSADPIHFKAQPWETHRFMNLSARSVRDFDAQRAEGVGNDYRPVWGEDSARPGVFVWGRTGFQGFGASGRDAQLYLLWSPMPEVDDALGFTWAPLYFSGLDAAGRPQFSELEIDAAPLDLDDTVAGVQPEETQDMVGQTNIAWVPSLDRFVMFYGGESVAMFTEPLVDGDSDQLRHDPEGSLFVRFAKQPWGPWTKPRVLLEAGSRDPEAQPSKLYGPGGILSHNHCGHRDCARSDPAYLLDLVHNNNGVLYGPSIVDNWTTVSEATTTLYWFVSTWNPYQTVLMKTQLSH